ncbi:MAG: HAD-IIB family hydrolase [Patescibacteria group bacterium]
MKKIIAFDLDGTLAESKHPISQDMAILISKLTEKAKVIVISGGSYSQYEKQFIPQMGTEHLENIILMPTNGSVRYEYKNNEPRVTKSFPFNDEVKEKVLAELNTIIGNEEFEVPTEHFGEYIEDRGTQITFSGYGQLAPIEKKMIWDLSRSKRLKIKEYLESKIPEIDAHVGGMTSVDILPKNFNKASGLMAYLEENDLTTDDIVFIGDAVFPGGNDYSPSQVGIETISTNGPEHTKEIIETLL